MSLYHAHHKINSYSNYKKNHLLSQQICHPILYKKKIFFNVHFQLTSCNLTHIYLNSQTLPTNIILIHILNNTIFFYTFPHKHTFYHKIQSINALFSLNSMFLLSYKLMLALNYIDRIQISQSLSFLYPMPAIEILN